ncbi:MAG TPA: glycosyltransferase family 2 protein [Thermodesulfovibrionales bacterium]|nr:glycosyltransferase family 2 protein [Thermodesulfovibrionales bacterium]
MDDRRYLVIIPALNEEATIEEVIREIKIHLPAADILVINDGSTDRTAAIALRQGVIVIDLPFNLGYGAALQTGFRFADKEGYESVITIDADGQHVPSSIESLLTTMEREAAHVVIGSRFIGGQYRTGIARKIGIWLFSRIARLYTGINITDPTSGFQLLKREVFSYLAEGDNYPLDYPDVNIIMILHKKKFKVVEAPVVMVNNPQKKSMHSGLNPIFYITKMVLAIIMVMMRREEK